MATETNEFLIQRNTLAATADTLRKYLGTLHYQFLPSIELGLLKTTYVRKLYYEEIDADEPCDGQSDNPGVFIATGYELNNNNEVVPVLYETNSSRIWDTYYYIGRSTIEGEEADKWRKIERVQPNENSEIFSTWTSSRIHYVYTEPVVQEVTSTQINPSNFPTAIDMAFEVGKHLGDIESTSWNFPGATDTNAYYEYINQFGSNGMLTFNIKFKVIGDNIPNKQYSQITFGDYNSNAGEIYFDGSTYVGTAGSISAFDTSVITFLERPSGELLRFLKTFAVPCETWIFRDDIATEDYASYLQNHGKTGQTGGGYWLGIQTPFVTPVNRSGYHFYDSMDFYLNNTGWGSEIVYCGDNYDSAASEGQFYLPESRTVIFTSKPTGEALHILKTFAIQQNGWNESLEFLDPELKAENIKAGITIFGIPGTYEIPLAERTLY